MRFKVQLLCDNRHSLVKIALIGLISFDAGNSSNVCNNQSILVAIRWYLFLFLRYKENDFQVFKAHCPAHYRRSEFNT